MELTRNILNLLVQYLCKIMANIAPSLQYNQQASSNYQSPYIVIQPN